MLFNYEVEREQDEITVRIFDYYLRDMDTLYLNKPCRGFITLEKGTESSSLRQDRIRIAEPEEKLFLIARICEPKDGYFRLTFTTNKNDMDIITYDYPSYKSWGLKRLGDKGMQQRSILHIEVAETLNDRKTMHIGDSWTLSKKMLQNGSKVFANEVVKKIKEGIKHRYAGVLRYRGSKTEAVKPNNV